jgi:Domain of unknown function (DUF6285)
MREAPGLAELVDAVSEFVSRDVAPTLSGRLAFHARVAVNVLATIRREIELGPAADRSEAERLAALLGRSGALATLNDELCRRIEAGEIDADDPALIDHLWATTLDTLAINQPGYGTYRALLRADAKRE